MATMESGKLNKNQKEPLRLRSRYIINNQSVVFPKPVVKGFFDVVKKSDILKSDQDAIALNISTPNETKLVKVLGGMGTNNQFKKVEIGGLDFLFKYGSKVYELPFSIKLNDFIADKYPGTEKSYSAFASEVTVIGDESFDYRIFMNNILNYKGYRFFQASFDPDEKGTVLSVNNDFWGTAITYLGYILLYIGLFSILFSGFTRFSYLKNQIQRLKIKKSNLISIVFFIFSFSINAQEANPHNAKNNQADINKIDSILFPASEINSNILSKFKVKECLIIDNYNNNIDEKLINLGNSFNEKLILPLICYEIIYSGEIKKNNQFPDLVVNISEDAWFGKSIGPNQHFSKAIYRSVEEGVFIARSANKGISAFIDPHGKVLKSLNTGESGNVELNFPYFNKPTFFSNYGNKIFFLIIMLYIFLTLIFKKYKI